jgi:hypothetical protein
MFHDGVFWGCSFFVTSCIGGYFFLWHRVLVVTSFNPKCWYLPSPRCYNPEHHYLTQYKFLVRVTCSARTEIARFLWSKITGHRLTYVSIPSSKTTLTYCVVGMMHYRRSPTVLIRPSTDSYPEPVEFTLHPYINSLKQFTEQRMVTQLFRAFLVCYAFRKCSLSTRHATSPYLRDTWFRLTPSC